MLDHNLGGKVPSVNNSAILSHYRNGMAAYDCCHPPTFQSQWTAFTAELKEFIVEPSSEEAWDVLHSFGRLVWKLTGVPLHLLAYPTVRKHGQRYTLCGNWLYP